MIEAPLYSAEGARRPAPFALPAETFDGTVHEPALHQAVRAYLNNQRQGTHATKTRSFVSGGNQKPWRQKGTGRARQGSIRAPHWRGGGTVFGPQPRDYHTDVPRKVKALARRSALNARAREGRLHVVEQVAFAAPKTQQLVALLGKLGVAEAKVLVLTHGLNRAAWLSSRNLPGVHVMPYAEASAYDILWSEHLVVERGAFTGEAPAPAEAAEAAPAAKRAPRAKAAGAPKAAKAAAGGAKAAKGTKAAAKKPAPKKKGSE